MRAVNDAVADVEFNYAGADDRRGASGQTGAAARSQPVLRGMRGKRVGAVSASLAILRHIGSQTCAVRATDIARVLNLNPSTCFNILQTLVAEGVVEFDTKTKVYWLRDQWWHSVESHDDLDIGDIKQEAERLSRKYQSFVTLWRRAAFDRLALVFATDNPLPFEIRMSPGSRVPLFAGSVGRVMAVVSGLPECQLKSRIERLRWDRKPPFDLYSRDLVAVRRNGWAIDRGYFARGFTTVSAPLMNGRGKVNYACSATILSGEENDVRCPTLGADLLALGRLLPRAA